MTSNVAAPAVEAEQPKSPIEELYEKYPSVRAVEAQDRLTPRRPVMKLLPKDGVGVELGVYTGAFSASLFEATTPSKLYLIDGWHQIFGKFYPDWGQYSDNGRLSTEAAQEAVRVRVAAMDGKAEIVVGRTYGWLEQQPPASLDWAYVDSSHDYTTTMRELEALDAALKPNGVIAGDDCAIDPTHRHFGVFRAIRDFTRRRPFEIIWMDGARQWAMRRWTEELPQPPKPVGAG